MPLESGPPFDFIVHDQDAVRHRRDTGRKLAVGLDYIFADDDFGIFRRIDTAGTIKKPSENDTARICHGTGERASFRGGDNIVA